MTWPVAVLWLLIIAATISRGPLIMYLFSSTVIFGGLTMAPPGLTGGLNVPAQTICAAILIVKVMLRSDNLAVALRHAFDVRKLGLLGFFMVYILITALLYPRLFAGAVQLYSLNQAGSLTPLHPSSTNFTQTTYLFVSCAMVFVLGIAGRSAQFRAHYIRSIVVAAVLLLGSGLVDLALSVVHHDDLLVAFHNASYNLLDTQSLAGQHRVVGFMPEASVYGLSTCTFLSFLVFNFRFFAPARRRWLIPLLIISLAYITFLSTSSTGYVGLIVLALAAFGRIGGRLVLIPIRSASQLRRTTYIISLLGLIAVLLVLFGPYFLAKYNHLLNVVLFNKTNSGSYQERSRWTRAGLNAFFATNGIGIGVGSVRTSNWFVNILASTGIAGITLFGAFVLKMLLPYRGYAKPEFARQANMLKLSLLPTAVMICISGTTPDPGVWVMSILGVIYSLRLQPQTATVQPRQTLRYRDAALKLSPPAG
jgi:hypothetical protein